MHHINELIEDYEAVLNYALRLRIPIDDSLVEVLLHAKTSNTNGLQPEQTTKQLMSAYPKLISLVPGDIDTILATEKKVPVRIFFISFRGWKATRVHQSLFILRFFLALFLVAALVVQLLWFHGTQYLKEYQNVSQQAEILSDRMRLMDSVKLEREFREMKVRAHQLNLEKKNISAALCRLDLAGSLDFDKDQGMNFAGLESCERCDNSEKQKIIVRTVSHKMTLFDTYLLPLLYGVLGALFYSLRSMISGIGRKMLPRDFMNMYKTRIFLGAISGLIMGWFIGAFKVNDKNILGTLSPLALSFLAGYSVEFFFTTIDKYLKTTRPPKSEPHATEKSPK